MKLTALTLGLRGLQIILALAVLGLSASLVKEQTCVTFNGAQKCYSTLESLFGTVPHALRTSRYSTFLGAYGAVAGALGLASLYLDIIPVIAPLAADCAGAVLHLAGGIAWTVDLSRISFSCSAMEFLDVDGRDSLMGACKRCEADHGLMWALFAFTACLAICDWLRRREQVQSSR